ncbi:hypothetical protein G7K_0662-t1 [Saitoella complicata NRRL Y-17804]|uniref:Uncharacterized protein n=1 Tax=Saitoella complicata (strain BCRC 22490 / CBS 7301 / JCM 7358 / NBRC 10748 / NRRL Y-17804) TaxID=698492 RepID=A0A0E9N9Q6_SAICN|nr:hypothetical protein G7K_0662-t1 [Saitoella complicata NRRL Y-17804]
MFDAIISIFGRVYGNEDTTNGKEQFRANHKITHTQTQTNPNTHTHTHPTHEERNIKPQTESKTNNQKSIS